MAKGKFAVILIFFTSILTLYMGRIVFFKVVHGEEYETAAKQQQINRYDMIITPNRGSILDRNEQVLAISTAVYNVILDPLILAELSEKNVEVKNETINTLCEYFPELDSTVLNNYLKLNPETGKINLESHWKVLVKGISRDLKEELEDLDLAGVYYDQTTKRSYPLKSTACHLLGFIRGGSSWGIEHEYDDYMNGTTGRSFILYENGNDVTYQDYEAKDGDTVITTIDYTIQQYAEEVVAETYKKWPAQAVEAIVMDPNTGEIIAMAEETLFDLNNPSIPLEIETNPDFKLLWEAMTPEEQTNYLNTIC